MISNTIGQIAIIYDSDGWTNVREKPDAKSQVIHKVSENEVFWCDYSIKDTQQEWVVVYIPKDAYCLNKVDPNFMVGFIHKSRILFIGSLKEYLGSDFKFQYKLTDFDSTNRIIDRDGNIIKRIDGRSIWGTDGGFPKTQVAGINVKINEQEIAIHKAFYSDIYECDNDFKIYKRGETYFVSQFNSDGAGAYDIVWVFDKNGLKQRYIGSMY